MIYRPEIDGLRALAVIPVVLFHAGVAGFAGGFIGVDVFFVISGFLITSIIARDLRGGEFSFLRFWERRARRILPALMVVVLFTLVVGWFLLSTVDYQRHGESAVAQSFFASNFVFWKQAGYFGPTASQLPLLHTWSLAVEEQFYLIFPLTMFLLTRFVIRLRWSFIALTVVASFLVSVWATDSAPTAAFYLSPSRAWELGVGALLALWAANRSNPVNRKLAEPASILGVALILLAVFAYDETTKFPGVAAVPPVLGSALIVWANTHQRTVAGNFLALKPIVFVGLISYSLYLWHWPLLIFTSYPTGSDSLSGLTAVVVIGLSFLVAYASYVFVETPFRKRRLWKSRRTMFSGSLASLLVVGAIGLFIRADISTDIRLSDTAIAYGEAAESRSERQRHCSLDPTGSAHISDIDSICMYGDLDGDAKFVVWGDSHVDSLLHAFDTLAEQFQITGMHLSRSVCPPILEVHVRIQNCASINSRAYNLIQELNITTVVLSGSWVRYGSEEDRLRPFNDSEFVPSDGSSLTALTEGMEHTVKRLIDSGIDVWLVRDVPKFGFDPPRRLFGVERFGKSINDIGITYEEYESSQAPIDRLFIELEQVGAQVINLPGMLCEADFCPVLIDGVVLYRDDGHLSIEGSRFVAPAFTQILESLIDNN